MYLKHGKPMFPSDCLRQRSFFFLTVIVLPYGNVIIGDNMCVFYRALSRRWKPSISNRK